MERVEKTVFISYRRSNAPWALALFQNLTEHGYDVFLDFNGIASGDFESVILGNITSRAHFLVLLTPSALEHCNQPGDWLRREIETALENKRNIIPLMLEGFSFATPSIASQLTGKLEQLKKYNALEIPPSYFEEGMARLRNKYLNVPLASVLHPVSASAKQGATEQKAAADAAPAVQEDELKAQQDFEHAFATMGLDEKLLFFNEFIRLRPDSVFGFNNRGLLLLEKGDIEGAFCDFNEVVRLSPDDARAYTCRGVVRQIKKDMRGALDDFEEALRLSPGDAELLNELLNLVDTARSAMERQAAPADFDEVIRLNPDNALAYFNRGLARWAGDMRAALADFNEAARLKPGDGKFLYWRGRGRFAIGDFQGAIADYNEAIRLKPDFADVFLNRGIVHLKNMGDFKSARADFNEAIRLNPEHADAFYWRGEVSQTERQPAAAIADYRQYLKLLGGDRDPKNAIAEHRIADLTKKL